MTRWLIRAGLPAMMGFCAVAGCTPAEYARQADQVACSTVNIGQRTALGEAEGFDVRYRPLPIDETDDRTEIRPDDKSIPLSGQEDTPITLNEALRIAFRNSRELQDRKEQLYSQALALASARRSWNWSDWSLPVEADAEHEAVHNDGDANAATAGAELSLTRKFIHGGVLVLAAGVDFATDFTGGSNTTVGSLLEANLTQPLLRGAWSGAAYEDHYRRERDFLFAVYDYERFRETFATQVVSRYYSLLSSRDQLRNERENIDRLKSTWKWTQIQAENGEVSIIQAHQARQDLLEAQVRYEQLQESYRDEVDRFKIFLGLPLSSGAVPDYPAGIDRIMDVAPRDLGIEESEAVRVALSTRPDVLTEVADLRDAARDVELSADEFLPGLDLEFGATAAGTDPRDFWRVRFHEHRRTARVTFNYDLDQTANRDAYRNAMLDYEKARRDLSEFLDEVRLEVRRAYRSLQRSRRSYELQQENVKIARRRRALAVEEQKSGMASARDVLEAEAGLLRAQNGLTSARLSYETTRLEFLATLGLVAVDERGQINERDDPFRFERIERIYEYLSSGDAAAEAAD
ncbi:MAG: TolC family protein [Planctomycetota bacterium]